VTRRVKILVSKYTSIDQLEAEAAVETQVTFSHIARMHAMELKQAIELGKLWRDVNIWPLPERIRKPILIMTKNWP